MPRRPKTVPARRGEARLYLEKAQQFAAEARTALEGSRHDAALLSAVHAAISAGDSITVSLAGVRSADPDHRRAVELLEDALGSEPGTRSRIGQLKALIAKKNLVEYESRRATPNEAREAVARAERLVRWAQEIVRRAKV